MNFVKNPFQKIILNTDDSLVLPELMSSHSEVLLQCLSFYQNFSYVNPAWLAITTNSYLFCLQSALDELIYFNSVRLANGDFLFVCQNEYCHQERSSFYSCFTYALWCSENIGSLEARLSEFADYPSFPSMVKFFNLFREHPVWLVDAAIALFAAEREHHRVHIVKSFRDLAFCCRAVCAYADHLSRYFSDVNINETMLITFRPSKRPDFLNAPNRFRALCNDFFPDMLESDECKEIVESW